MPGGQKPAEGTGFYFVDVHEIEANKLEELWGRYLVHGASLVPVPGLGMPGEARTREGHQADEARDPYPSAAEAAARHRGTGGRATPKTRCERARRP